jgi:hypothetical protein
MWLCHDGCQLQAVIVTDPATYSVKLARLLEGGRDALQVIADFDRTLTTAFAADGVAP